MAVHPLTTLLLGLGLFRCCEAVTWKVSKAQDLGLPTWVGLPPESPDCTVEGVCKPYATTIPNGTLLYWCGWSTKQRTEYWVPSTGANVTVALMRESELQGCALPSLSNIKNCKFIDSSTCDTSIKCYKKVYGLSFVDPACVVIANNDASEAPVKITVWQYYDSRRYYGTAFSVLLFILMMGFTLGQMGYTCYHQIRKPNHRLDELEKLARAKTPSVSVQLAHRGGGPGSDTSDSLALGGVHPRKQPLLHGQTSTEVEDSGSSVHPMMVEGAPQGAVSGAVVVLGARTTRLVAVVGMVGAASG